MYSTSGARGGDLIRHRRNLYDFDYEVGMRARRHSDYLRGRGIVVSAVF
jgi:hypothetical protein